MFHVKHKELMQRIQPTNSENTFKVKDHFLTQKEFYLNKNSEFGYLETHPIPENLSEFYKSENYISHTDSRKSLFEKVYQKLKLYNIRYKFSKLDHKENGKKLLDIGCGTGDFLQFAQKKGLKVFGIEPNQKAIEIAKNKIGREGEFFDELSDTDETFDSITLWHVLEHIPDLNQTLIEIKSKLKSEGELIIAVPNYKSFDAKFYQSFWAAYDVPRHLWHFSPEDFDRLMNHHGMKIVNKYPLLLDSFYVSLLSEKYKGNRWGIFRAMLIGTISNFLGIWNGNYSSIIYKIKKY